MAAGLVIFDCDGVLVDTEHLSSRVMASFVRAAGWALDDAAVRARFLGWRLPRVRAAVEAEIGHALPLDWLEDFQAARVAAFEREGVPEIPGARAAVAGLREAGIPVCVASNAILEKTRMTLGMTEMIELFDPERLFSATMVARGKPAPDLFLHAAAACGVAPERCVVVEDSPTGIQAARAAGMRALAYAGDGEAAAALRAAGGELVHDLRDVPALVA